MEIRAFYISRALFAFSEVMDGYNRYSERSADQDTDGG